MWETGDQHASGRRSEIALRDCACALSLEHLGQVLSRWGSQFSKLSGVCASFSVRVLVCIVTS